MEEEDVKISVDELGSLLSARRPMHADPSPDTSPSTHPKRPRCLLAEEDDNGAANTEKDGASLSDQESGEVEAEGVVPGHLAAVRERLREIGDSCSQDLRRLQTLMQKRPVSSSSSCRESHIAYVASSQQGSIALDVTAEDRTSPKDPREDHSSLHDRMGRIEQCAVRALLSCDNPSSSSMESSDPIANRKIVALQAALAEQRRQMGEVVAQHDAWKHRCAELREELARAENELIHVRSVCASQVGRLEYMLAAANAKIEGGLMTAEDIHTKAAEAITHFQSQLLYWQERYGTAVNASPPLSVVALDRQMAKMEERIRHQQHAINHLHRDSALCAEAVARFCSSDVEPQQQQPSSDGNAPPPGRWVHSLYAELSPHGRQLLRTALQPPQQQQQHQKKQPIDSTAKSRYFPPWALLFGTPEATQQQQQQQQQQGNSTSDEEWPPLRTSGRLRPFRVKRRKDKGRAARLAATRRRARRGGRGGGGAGKPSAPRPPAAAGAVPHSTALHAIPDPFRVTWPDGAQRHEGADTSGSRREDGGASSEARDGVQRGSSEKGSLAECVTTLSIEEAAGDRESWSGSLAMVGDEGIERERTAVTSLVKSEARLVAEWVMGDIGGDTHPNPPPHATLLKEIFKAAANADLASLDVLLRVCPSPSALPNAPCQWCPLHAAAFFSPTAAAAAAGGGDRLGVVERLLAKSWPVDHSSAGGMTALHMAALTGRDECVGSLMGAGADVTAVDSRGNTALHLACTQGCIRSLLEHGAAADAANNTGHTPSLVAFFSPTAAAEAHTPPNSREAAADGSSTVEGVAYRVVGTSQWQTFHSTQQKGISIATVVRESVMRVMADLGTHAADSSDYAHFAQWPKGRYLLELTKHETRYGIWSDYVCNFTASSLADAVSVGLMSAHMPGHTIEELQKQVLVVTSHRMAFIHVGTASLARLVAIQDIQALVVPSWSSVLLLIRPKSGPDILIDTPKRTQLVYLLRQNGTNLTRRGTPCDAVEVPPAPTPPPPPFPTAHRPHPCQQQAAEPTPTHTPALAPTNTAFDPSVATPLQQPQRSGDDLGEQEGHEGTIGSLIFGPILRAAASASAAPQYSATPTATREAQPGTLSSVSFMRDIKGIVANVMGGVRWAAAAAAGEQGEEGDWHGDCGDECIDEEEGGLTTIVQQDGFSHPALFLTSEAILPLRDGPTTATQQRAVDVVCVRPEVFLLVAASPMSIIHRGPSSSTPPPLYFSFLAFWTAPLGEGLSPWCDGYEDGLAVAGSDPYRPLWELNFAVLKKHMEGSGVLEWSRRPGETADKMIGRLSCRHIRELTVLDSPDGHPCLLIDLVTDTPDGPLARVRYLVRAETDANRRQWVSALQAVCCSMASSRPVVVRNAVGVTDSRSLLVQ
ncbi:unnamed protein product [Vitrella brassicaformis CCMP3155]|uniref:PH domain-containing protein n=2 Tax=Vitrella brassicaformis TaxID=1169539 RepID=A0A0G4FYX5_VITBC|nr:unnamed protein product [Vitrella brassicaformis CCMP3155]|eukprot:CEM20506.1 unnamed protein product [Vitrella brassicaformis CCMP3155]